MKFFFKHAKGVRLEPANKKFEIIRHEPVIMKMMMNLRMAGHGKIPALQ